MQNKFLDIFDGVSIGTEETDHVREGMASYILHRKFGTPMEGSAREFVGQTWFDMGRHCLEMGGSTTRGVDRLTLASRMLMQRDATGALGQSHFPLLVAAVVNKALSRGYGLARILYPIFSAKRVAPDLKALREIYVDSATDLAAVNEFGDYTYATMSEGQEIWYIARRGKIIKLTPELIINDDLDAVTQVPLRLGESSGRTREKLFWSRVQAATAMADGDPVYHANHNNLLASGAAPSWTQIAAMRAKSWQQTDRSGELIEIELDRFAFPSALEGSVAQLWSEITPQQATNAVPEELKRSQRHIAPRLDATSTTAYYGFANPEIHPAFKHGELEGRAGPTITEALDFDSGCLKFLCEDYFGVGATDHRPTVKNPGA